MLNMKRERGGVDKKISINLTPLSIWELLSSQHPPSKGSSVATKTISGGSNYRRVHPSPRHLRHRRHSVAPFRPVLRPTWTGDIVAYWCHVIAFWRRVMRCHAEAHSHIAPTDKGQRRSDLFMCDIQALGLRIHQQQLSSLFYKYMYSYTYRCIFVRLYSIQVHIHEGLARQAPWRAANETI